LFKEGRICVKEETRWKIRKRGINEGINGGKMGKEEMVLEGNGVKRFK